MKAAFTVETKKKIIRKAQTDAEQGKVEGKIVLKVA